MKVFVSVPMKRKTDAEIAASIKMCKDYMDGFNLNIEYADNFVHHRPSKGVIVTSVYYLGEALKVLSTCDALVIPKGVNLDEYNGCAIEVEVAKRYNIPVFEAYEGGPFNETH